MYNLAKKNLLGRHLMRMQKILPEDYDFFPRTYCLPHDMKDFLAQINEKRTKTFIVKPEAACQGKGIFLTRNPEKLATLALKKFDHLESPSKQQPGAVNAGETSHSS
jgi:tubulin polyglutamylase TTLL6/13